MTDQELEVKFYLQNMPALEKKLRSLPEATLIQPRTHEINLRFDDAAGELSRGQRILRLRQDAEAVLTYKGRSEDRQDVAARQEIEVVVSDFAVTRRLLEALGYHVYVTYEKYRSTYRLGRVRVTLDEMPYGDFAEIEGPDPLEIQAAAEQLKLDWSARVMENYLALFERLPPTLIAGKRDLTFDNFHGLTVKPADLGVRPADVPLPAAS